MSQEYFSNIIKTEIINTNVYYTKLNKEKNYIQKIHSKKVKEQIEKTNLYNLRKKLNELPEQIHEQVRQNFIRQKDIKMRECQQKQCNVLNMLEKMIRKKLIELNLDYRKFSIGGYDGGLFEKMFKIQPSRFMSKAQFFNVMRDVFSFDLSIKTEQQLNLLFSAFDIEERNEVDWRAFLYQLALIIQAYETVQTHLKIGYAIFSSIGTLEFDCTERLKLSTIKDMIEVPIIFSSRSTIRSLIDDCWFELTQTDLEAMEIVHSKNAPTDSDDIFLTFNLFNKLINNTSFNVNLESAKPFGKRDNRTHLYVLEDNYYHPNIIKIILTLRREIRCDNEADLFIARKNHRLKVMCYQLWIQYRRRRELCRRVAVDMFVHWCHAKQSIFFDHWRKFIILEKHTETIQRYSRGLIGRYRRKLMIKLNNNAIKIQTINRTKYQQKMYQRKLLKIYWAAVMIQKTYRGVLGRRKVMNRIYSKFDTELRNLKKERERYFEERKARAAQRIQNYVKKFLRKMRAYHKRQKYLAKLRVEEEIIYHKKDILRRQREYRHELEEWFRKRKEEYDRDRLVESQTFREKSKIIAYRRRIDYYEKEKKEKQRLEKNELLEEQRIDQWIKMWDQKKIDRSKAHMAECRHALLNPETPAQRLMKKALQLRIKERIPEVLRKADRMRIPMEIPEAKEIATEDVIEMEGKEEIERVEKEMFEAAQEAERIKQQKLLEEAEKEAKRKERIKEWAAIKIQTTARIMFARRVLRSKAYKRYRKEFDPYTKAYYYINTYNNTSSWDKPPSLGSYDIDCKDHWIVLRNNLNPTEDAIDNQPYYYNPLTWKMQWTQPKGTVLCSECKLNGFAVMKLENNSKFYCETHFHEIVNKLLNDGVIASNIKFKSFDGSVCGSSKTYWGSIPTENWLVYSVQLADKMKSQQRLLQKNEDEDGDDDGINYNSITYNRAESDAFDDGYGIGDYDEEVIPLCSRCETFQSEKRCYNCEAFFCNKCFDRKHKTPPWSSHTYKDIQPTSTSAASMSATTATEIITT